LSRQAAMSNIVDFCNPLLPAPSQDPWVMVHEGMFHALNTDGHRIFLRRPFDVLNLFAQPAVTVWKAPSSGPASKHLWAPELHLLDGRWLIYYAADDGRNRNHRLWTLQAGRPCGVTWKHSVIVRELLSARGLCREDGQERLVLGLD
jgi:GH43 family beta-xylosidase